MAVKTKPFAIIHHFPGGTKKQYAASVAAVHPGKGLPKGQVFHAAGPSDGGWTIVALHDSKKSWVKFRDTILIPRFKKGIKGGFKTLPEETSILVQTLKA